MTLVTVPDKQAKFLTTLGQIITRASTILADADPAAPNTRWSVPSLIDYANEGIREILGRRPEAFARTVKMSLQPGQSQRLDEQYHSLISIEETYDEFGVPHPVTESNYQYARLMRKPTIKTYYGDRYMVASYSRHPYDEHLFMVDPIVPANARAEVKAVVAYRPAPFSSEDLDKPIGIRPDFEPQLVDWVLHRAFAVDAESEHMLARSKDSLKAFHDALEQKFIYRHRHHHGLAGLMDSSQPPMRGETK